MGSLLFPLTSICSAAWTTCGVVVLAMAVAANHPAALEAWTPLVYMKTAPLYEPVPERPPQVCRCTWREYGEQAVGASCDHGSTEMLAQEWARDWRRNMMSTS